MALKGPCSCKDRGIHIYQWTPATKAAALRRHRESWQQHTDRAEAAGDETGAN